jgi:hypothetical protein
MALYDALRKTITSRFSSFGKLCLLSYKYADSDLMEILYRRAEKSEKAYTSRAPTWVVNLGVKHEDLAEEYLQDPDNAKRVFECIGESSEGGYIKRRSAITRMALPTKEITTYNPVVDNRVTISDVGSLRFKDGFRGQEGKLYVVHVDLAKGKTTKRGDAAGFMLAHPEPMHPEYGEDVTEELLKMGINAQPQMEAAVKRPMKGIVVDLALQLIAPQGGEIIFADLRSLIYRLRDVYGFKIIFAGYDGFESTDSLQELQRQGIPSGNISVDKTTEPYDTFKSLLYQGLFRAYKHPVLERELKELEEIGGKVDHPVHSWRRELEEGINRGSKDVADCAAAVTYKIVNDVPLQPGIFLGGL